jgi:hypothetical protein
MSVEKTDLIVDNAYMTPRYTNVEGNSDTDVWAPDQVLNITVREDEVDGLDVSNAQRVRVSAEHDVAATVDVSGLSQVVL